MSTSNGDSSVPRSRRTARLPSHLPRFIPTVVTVIAFAIALVTVLIIGNQQPTLQQGLLLAMAAALLALTSPLGLPPARGMLPRPAIADVHRLLPGLALVALGCIIAAAGGVIGYGSFDALFYSGLRAYAVGFGLVALGLAIAADWRPKRAIARWREAIGAHRRETLAVALVLLLGLAFRVYQLDYYPPPEGFALVDEPQIGLAATQFLRFGGHPWVYPELTYAAVVVFKLFGASMLTLRFPSVLVGFLLLLPFYALARQFFSPPAALMGTALLAVSRWEIAYTRLILPSCTMMLAEVIIVLLAVRAVRGRATYASYALIGFLLGAGLYSHVSFRLVPILLFLWTLGFLIVRRHDLGAILRWHLTGAILLVIMAVSVALPYGGIVKQNSTAFNERLTSIMPLLFNPSGISNPSALLSDHVRALLGYFVGPGDSWLAVNVPNAPMLDPVTATLCLLGLGYGLLHFNRPYILIILSWLALTLTAGAIVTLDFRPERFIACLPPIFLLTCLPIEAVARRVHALPLRKAMLPAAVLLATFGGALWVNAAALYNTQSHNLAVRSTFDPAPIDTVKYFRGAGHDDLNFLFADFPFPGPGSDWGWMADDPPGRDPIDLADTLPVHEPLVGSQMHAMIAQPYPYAELARAFKTVYPGAQLSTWTNTLNGNSYSAVTVSGAEIARQQGLSGPCPRPTPCHGTPTRVGGRAGTVYWAGSLYIPTDGQYSLHALNADGKEAVVQLEGRPAVGLLALHVGWYSFSIAIRDTAAGGGRPSLQWTGPNVGGAIPPPYLRNTLAHGLLERFLSPTDPSLDLIPPERIPVPFFLFTFGHNGGRPWVAQHGFPFAATLTGVISAGHTI